MSEPINTHEVHIRKGVLINYDSQRRCYNGCYIKSHIEWTEWERWIDMPSEEHAMRTARLFARDNQQLKVVLKENSNDEE